MLKSRRLRWFLIAQHIPKPILSMEDPVPVFRSRATEVCPKVTQLFGKQPIYW